MADTDAPGITAPVASAALSGTVAGPAPGLSPGRRAWLRFRRNRLGYWSLLVFCTLVVLSLFAEVVSNDRPLLVRYEGKTYFPLWNDYPEKTFGGDFEAPADYLDPFIRERLSQGGNWVVFAPNPYGPKTLNYFAAEPNPSRPTRANLLGTDDRGRDLLAQLIYGFRVSVLFALALTATGVLLGVAAGAVQGFFGGKTDLAFQRFLEIWGSMPELYLLIIFSAVFAPSIALLLILLSLFGWMGLSDYVRAEFLRNRQLDYVRAARALGVGNWQIIVRHVLPNSLTPVVTFLPFRMSGAILALTSLDFLGLGVPPGTPSLGELLSQGKNSIDAWWITLSTFSVLVGTLLLLTFMGDALRDALDPRKADQEPVAAPQIASGLARPAADARVAPPQPALLDVRGLRIAFGGKEVVHGIDLSIAPGEKLALVGESGSGKTVTALSLLRLAMNAHIQGQAHFQPRQGAEVDLLALPERQLRGLRGQDIAMIFQEPMTALNPLYSVGEQIAEVLQLKQGLSRAQAAKAAVALLADTGIPEPGRRAAAFPHQLSGGQRQRAMIAMALACKPRLLLADEPTTALDVTVRAQILDLLGALQREYGMAVLMITHDLNLVRKFADRVAVMEHGHIVEQGSVAQVLSQAQHPYTRKLVDSRPERRVVEKPPAQTAPELQPMWAKDLSVAYPVPLPGLRGWFRKGRFVAVRGVGFAIAPGRTLGVIGESGSGKSTLALAALGLQAFEGELQVEGHVWGRDPAADKAMRRRVQVVFQDPFSSLSPRMTVEEIVGEGLHVHEPETTAAVRQQRVLQVLSEVGLTAQEFPNLLGRYPHEFSGGQRQRIAIARALLVAPALLVLDEPTSALDVTIQKQVLELLQRLQRERGLSYLLITHDVDVIRAMAHEVLVMKDGVVVESGGLAEVLDAPREAYTQALVAAAAPGVAKA